MGARIEVKAETGGQERLIEALRSGDVDIVGVFGPSGTGKSFVTMLVGVSMVYEEKYSRMVVVRPLVDVKTGREYTMAELGELYNQTMLSYLFDLLAGYVPKQEIVKMVDDGRLVFADPHFLRGRTFDEALIFLDDAQLASIETLTEVLIRVGRGSKLVIAGDPITQKEALGEKDGATLAREILLGEDRAVVIDLGIKDIVRPGAKRGFKLALELRMRKRELSEEERKVVEAAYTHAPDADIVTVVVLRDVKERYGVPTAPDALIVSKEGYLGRLVGKGGERIQAIETDVGMSIRAIELTGDLRKIVVAVHPLPWVEKHIQDVDIAGPNLVVRVDKNQLGPFIGVKGANIRVVDEVFRRLLSIGVRAEGVEKRRRRR